MENKTKITYRRVGDFLIPNLILPPEAANITLGKWGMMYKSYLEKHKSPLFNSLLIKGKLYQHCAEVENQALDMFDNLVEQMKEKEGIGEQLKKEKQIEWLQMMNNIQNRAKELTENELIYT